MRIDAVVKPPKMSIAKMPFEDRMNEARFWQLIEQGGREPKRFTMILRDVDRDDLIAFREQFLTRASELITEKLEDLLCDCSEDALEDLTEWVVSQGQAYYERVLEDPAKAIPTQFFDMEDSLNENTFSGIVENEFFRRYGESITNYE